MARTSEPGLGKWLRLCLGMVLGIGFLILLWLSVDMARVGALLMRAAWPPLLVALAAYGLDFILRAFRFWLLLDMRRERTTPFWPTVSPFVASFGISDILPFRVGDAFRLYWFHRHFSLPVGHVLGAIIVERVLDLVSILVLASAALFVVDTRLPPEVMVQFQSVLSLTVGASLLVLLAPALIERAAGWLERRFAGHLVSGLAAIGRSTSEAVRSKGGLRQMAGMILLSTGLWMLESLVMLGAWLSLGGELQAWLKPLVAFSVSTLGTLVPALPGHFGSYEYFGLLSYRAVGVDAALATATILLAHLILWLPTAVFGVGWLVAARRKGAPRLRTMP